jgi:hypothetical protein
MIMTNEGLIKDGREFPLIVELNFTKLIESGMERAKGDDPLARLLQNFLNNPKLEKLKSGLRTEKEIEEHKDEIGLLMDTIFPHPLQNNEIKAALIPYVDLIFYKSNRFKKILEAAGPDYVLTTRNMDKDNAYIMGCSLVLAMHYHYKIDFRRPFFFDIPDANGIIRHYRVLFNGDFMEIIPTDKAKAITDEDVALLIDNFDDIDLWKEKFPPNSYIFRGFGIANMFDVTIDESISDIKTNFIHRTAQSFPNVQQSLRKVFGNEQIDLGITRYHHNRQVFETVPDPAVKSILLGDNHELKHKDAFCGHLIKEVLEKQKVTAVSDLCAYGKKTNYNQFYQNLFDKGYQSYLCAPLLDGPHVIGVIELASPVNQFLNSINANKLDDITPILSVVMKQSKEDHKNMLEVIIQEECTSIHPAVAWRFEEEAEKFYRNKLLQKEAVFEEIVFDEVYPLYGQCDIRGSSDARNLAIKNDLMTQLNAAEKIIKQAVSQSHLPIYDELIYRLSQYKKSLELGLGAGSDQQILEFLKSDVYPVFEHLKGEDSDLATAIGQYMDMLDHELKMIYKSRKSYDESVMRINKHLTSYLDVRANEAQKMFPHFFERYKTDGVEFNMYIGQSLVKDRKFNEVYLHNLKLWQLTTMCELERQFNLIQPDLKSPLDIASLILVYSTPLSIRFRMDEKQFDVDGAYNARYEIVKKRIDKAYIKGTTERLTQPGQISIVYSQQHERLEYDKYAQYLLALGYIKGEVEYHILEDLQGITGLRAMRYTVNHEPPPQPPKSSHARAKKEVLN